MITEDLKLPPHIELRNGAYFNLLNQRWVGDYKIKKICDDYWENEHASPVIPTGNGAVVFKKGFVEPKKERKKYAFKSKREVEIENTEPIIIPEYGQHKNVQSADLQEMTFFEEPEPVEQVCEVDLSRTPFLAEVLETVEATAPTSHLITEKENNYENIS